MKIPRDCPTCITDIRAAPGVKAVSFPSNLWSFIGLNVADPDHPPPGLDDDGNLFDQGHHPIFGDGRVRRALQRAIDVQAIIQGAVNGEGTQMASILIPTSWAADPDLAPVPYDPALAAQMLDEAGWRLARTASASARAASMPWTAHLLRSSWSPTKTT